MKDEHTSLENIKCMDETKTIIDRYVLTIGRILNKTVLDFGCGCGHGAMLMHTYGAKKVIGYDINENAINEAIKRYGYNNGFAFTNHFEHIKGNKYDVIVSLENLEHLDKESTKDFLNLINNNLNDNGLVILSTPQGDGKPHGKHKLEYTKKQLVDLFEKNTNLRFRIFFLEEKQQGLTMNTIVKNEEENFKCFFLIGRKK